MTAPDLLACPFCGGEAAYDFHAKGMPGVWENDCDHWVYCRADDCFANVGLCESKAEAIAAWNRRATPAATDPKVKALVEAATKTRAAQKAYFRDRSRENLIASKQAEAELDAALAALREGGDAHGGKDG